MAFPEYVPPLSAPLGSETLSFRLFLGRADFQLGHRTYVALSFSLSSFRKKQSSTLCKDAVSSNPIYQTAGIPLQARTCLRHPRCCPPQTAAGSSYTPLTLLPALLRALPARKRHTNLVPRAPLLRSHSPAQALAGQCRSSSLLPVSHEPHSYLRVKAASQGADIHVQVFQQSCCPAETLKVLKKEMASVEF